MCGDGSAISEVNGCVEERQWNEWRCKQGYNETKQSCRRWPGLFAWICHLYAEFVRFVCTVWGLVAVTACVLWYGTVGGGENVTLNLGFFYPLDGSGLARVVERASTLIHEARHIGKKPHDAQFPAGSEYGAGEDGADSVGL